MDAMRKAKPIIGAALVLALLQAPANGHDRRDSRDGRKDPPSLQGVWQVSITPVDCATDAPIPNAASEALFTFHAGGTMEAWAQNAKITTTRSPSHGVWRFNARWKNFSARFVHLRYDLANGIYVGTQLADTLVVLDRGGDTFTSEGSTVGRDTAGNDLFHGCSKASGVRLKLDP